MQMNKKSKALFWGIKKNNEYKNISIFRPLINKTKKSLENYCLKHKIAYGIDESNSTDLYERNRIRKVLNNKKTFKNAYKQIKKHNSLNKKMLNTVASIYSQWKESQYNDVWFKNQEKQYKYYLIYNLLSENNITNISTEKINNLITFVEKAQKNKFYRLGDGLYIKKL
jgi:tRNA(Ile)-lysidine synthase